MSKSIVRVAARKWYGVTAWAITRVDGVTSLWGDLDSYGDLIMKKRMPRQEDGNVPAHLAAMESDLFSKLQPIVMHCAETRYDDGTVRVPGWITVKTMGSAWVLDIKDPDTCSRLTVVQSTLDDAMALASLLLEAEEAPWEHDQWLAATKAKKKK
jgi:hypothetical protein